MVVFCFNSEDSKSSCNLYLQLCLLFGPLGLKMFTWGPKAGKFYPHFIQPYILTHCFYLLSVESSEYEISLIPSDMEPKQIILGPMAFIKAESLQLETPAELDTCHLGKAVLLASMVTPVTTWISQSFSSWGLGSESLFSLNKIVSGL